MECSIVELRQYTLQPGQRDVLIELFEREFLESQELAGMTLIGQFRAAHDADRFVWLRGFADMESRAKALASFYGGPVWAAHRAAANATMIDSDNVLLLRPAYPGSGFAMSPGAPFPRRREESSEKRYIASIRYLSEPPDRGVVEHSERTINPLIGGAGGRVLAWLVTEQRANNYPALPVREGLNGLVWIAEFPAAANTDDYLASLSDLADSPESIELMPTARSRLN